MGLNSAFKGLNITGRGLNELVTLYVGTHFYNALFKERKKEAKTWKKT